MNATEVLTHVHRDLRAWRINGGQNASGLHGIDTLKSVPCEACLDIGCSR